MIANAVARDATAPRCFAHDLPDELFSSDALDEICRAAAARDQLTVQIPDSSRERLGQRPELTQPRYPILQDALERPVHYRIFNTATWGPRSHAECRARLFELAGPDASLGDIPRETVVRVFSPGALVALHGDPDAKLVAGFAGTTVWWVRPVHAMTQLQHENLLRGEFFLPFTDAPGGAFRCSSIPAARASSRRAGRTGSTTPATVPASRSTSASTRATTCAHARSTTSTG